MGEIIAGHDIVEIISNILENSDIIQNTLNKYSYSAEHSLHCFYLHKSSNEIPYYFRIFINDEEYGIMAFFIKSKNSWSIFAGVLAPEKMRLKVFMNFLDYAFNDNRNIKKVIVEFETSFRKSLLKELRNNDKYKALRLNFSFLWPVFELDKWNGDLMQGGEWKDLRYYWNKFFRDHKVEFKTANEVSKTDMKQLVHEWKEQRNHVDRAYEDYYLNVIDEDFAGYDVTRLMIVDGKLCAINAGYKLANKDYYYAAIGLYNRAFDRIGEIANIDDLINLKKLGMHTIDFGGSWGRLITFKEKFHPTRWYKTHVFSIVKK